MTSGSREGHSGSPGGAVVQVGIGVGAGGFVYDVADDFGGARMECRPMVTSVGAFMRAANFTTSK